jgi:hypothetical protein
MRKNNPLVHRLSFKAVINVKDTEVAKELLRKLIDLGFTFEADTAYVTTSCTNALLYRNSTEVINTLDVAHEAILWSFNFAGGGYNSVFAATLDEAICQASITFKGMSIQPGSFKPHRTKASQDAYYASLPLMD